MPNYDCRGRNLATSVVLSDSLAIARQSTIMLCCHQNRTLNFDSTDLAVTVRFVGADCEASPSISRDLELIDEPIPP